MSLVAPIEEGKVVTTTSTESLSNSTSSSSSNGVVSSDTFLTMLVAEMQNQDPLEPTSNTEWVSQYATFTEVEKMDEMGDSMDLMRANQLVGQNVIMKVTSSSTGDTSYVQGIVDFVVYEEGKAYLYIDDQPYALEDLDTVATQEYTDAYALASEFTAKLSKLPTASNITTSYQSTVQELLDTYNGMTEYQKEFVSSSYVSALSTYKTALENLGVTFTDSTATATETTTTMDDLLAAFNTKMDAILAGITNISTASSSDNSSGSDANTTSTDSTQNNIAETNGTTVTEDDTEGTNGTLETEGNTEGVDETTGTEGNTSDETDNSSETTDNTGGSTDASESTEETSSSDGETEASSDTSSSGDSSEESLSSDEDNEVEISEAV